MDVLKGCASNVHVVKDIDTTRLRLFVCEEVQQIPGVVKELRSNGAMCSAASDRLCIFYGAEEETSDHVETPFRLELEGTIAEHNQLTLPNGQFIVSAFLDALEGSITFALQRARNTLKLGRWTWLLSDAGRFRSGIIVLMQPQLSEDSKRLHISTTVRQSNLGHVTEDASSDSRELIIAPSGTPATLVSAAVIGIGRDRPTNSMSASRNGLWKTSVLEALAQEGVLLPKHVAWVNIIPFGTQQHVCWPAPLCFFWLDNASTVMNSDPSFDEWRRWFNSSDGAHYDDPLVFAANWFTTFAEREQAMQTGEATAYEEMKMDDMPVVQARNENTTFDVSSPPLTHRPELQALHGIYPTPPDGLAVHAAPQLQMHSDVIAASNAEMPQLPTFTPSDPAPESNIPLFENGHDVEVDPPQRNHSIASSVGPHPQDWNRGSTDDLFGDMDDLGYGREEVGDADFNFFDEPDTDPPKADVGRRPFSSSEAVTEPEAELPVSSSQQDVKPEREAAPNVEVAQAHDKLQLPENDHLDHMEGVVPASTVSFSGFDVDVFTTPALRKEQPSPVLQVSKAHEADEIKPLSPFGIREALLPPPIPASASHSQFGAAKDRRRSSFGPLVFNAGGTFAPKSSTYDYSDYKPEDRKSSYDMGPTKVPLTSISESSGSVGTPSSSVDEESDAETESDSEEDSLSTSSDEEPIATAIREERPNLGTKKRKRAFDASASCGPESAYEPQEDQMPPGAKHGNPDGDLPSQPQVLLARLLGKSGSSSMAVQSENQLATLGSSELTNSGTPGIMRMTGDGFPASDKPALTGRATSAKSLYPDLMDVLPGLTASEFVVLGQIVAEQAVTVTRAISRELASWKLIADDPVGTELSMLREVEATLKEISPAVDPCDMTSLALVREPLPIQRPQPPQTNANQSSQARHPPRPPSRVEQNAPGLEIVPLTASFIRANRGDCLWEMAPAALDFWETLGLGPVSGAKDIRQVCLVPDNAALDLPIAGFFQNLKAAYEGCKFGSMTLGTECGGDANAGDATLTRPVAFDGHNGTSLVAALLAYYLACANVGAELSTIGFDDPGRTIVVSMISPFPSATDEETAFANQFLSACFLNLHKIYRSTAARQAKGDKKSKSQRTVSDIDFKILPIEFVASSSGLVVLTAQQMSLLARELYDRCPPSSDVVNESSPLNNAAAPSVELVAPLPKRISFLLTSDPPADLLHEASVLHVAYATSADGKWVHVVWHDNTGRYTNSNSFCLRGRSFAEIALEVWELTVELIKAREVIWRIFIVTTGSDGIEKSRANCWKDIIAQHTERKQVLSVTLLHFQPDLALSIIPPFDSQYGQGTGSGAPTPAATPLPGVSTTSPDTVGTGNTTITAPPTPAPSEAASGIIEADPEAHLIETEDETWGMLIDRDVASTLRPLPTNWTRPISPYQQNNIEALAHGVLIKRGALHSNENTNNTSSKPRPYPCAGASLAWTLRVRPKSERQGTGERPNVDEGSARHAEVMLREVMGLYRNLGILSKVKGLDATGLTPVHIVSAARGAEGLNGLLGR
jgi:mediator of RNA polymerase II transcription subunit 13